MADGQRLDPFRGYNFRVTFGNINGIIAFKSVSGLEREIAQTEYREGTDEATVRKLPGLATYPNIVFERGITDNVDLIRWMDRIVNLTREGQLDPDDEFRDNITIELLNRRQETVRTWRVREAWPCKLSITNFDAESNDPVLDMVELCHEGWIITEA